jgi:hypothetical protein
MATGLNQFLISNVLGSTMVPGRRHPFGHFGALSNVAEMLKSREALEPSTSGMTAADDHSIAAAFEDVRHGLSPDRLLADPELTEKFLKRCRAYGVTAPAGEINRRLLRFRKSPPKGVKLKKTSVRAESHNHGAYLFAAELASRQLQYRYGASIDDILAEPLIGAEFDRMASEIAPGRSPVEYRLAALYVRKVMRVCETDDLGQFAKADVAEIDVKLHQLGSLAEITDESVPAEPGIFALTEVAATSRDLYITKNPDLRLGIAPFRNPHVFDVLGNHLWVPDLGRIQVQVFRGEKFKGLALRIWELKLIQQRSPIFNLSIQLKNRKVA